MANIEDLLTGAYIEIAVVESLGTAEETETIIGETMGETTVSGDYNEAEFDLHEMAWGVTKTMRGRISLEFVCALVTDAPQLETLGLYDPDATGNGTVPSATHDIRLYVYPDVPEVASAEGVVFEFYSGDTRLDDLSMPQDGSEVNFSVRANGGWKPGKTETAA